MPSLIDLMLQGRRVAQHGPWPRRGRCGRLECCALGELARGRWSLLGLWGEPAAVHMAHACDDRAAEIAVVMSCIAPIGGYPSVALASSAGAAAGTQRPRPVRPVGRRACPIPRPWLDHDRWGVRVPLGRSHRRAAEGRALSLPAGRRRGAAPDPGRSGACRHHRARPFPLHRERRDRGAARRAAGLCPQGHRGADGRRQSRARPHSSPDASPATAPSPMPMRLCARRRSGARQSRRRRARGLAARAAWPNSSGSPTISATSARSATMPPSR